MHFFAMYNVQQQNCFAVELGVHTVCTLQTLKKNILINKTLAHLINLPCTNIKLR